MAKVLLVGPLPPPYGGATVSFKRFLDFLNDSDAQITHYDLPIRRNRDQNPPGPINHLPNFLTILGVLLRIPFHRSVVVFASRNFGFTYGLLILLCARICFKDCAIRFFGGHPYRTASLPRPLRPLTRLLALAHRILVQTESGKAEFPASLQRKITVITGYRARPKRDAPIPKSEHLRFAYVGANHKKGIEIMLSAWSQLQQEASLPPHAELHVYGPTDKKPGAQKRIEGSPGLVYHGKVPNTQLLEQLPACHMLLFPSIYNNEGHPGILIEAFQAGLPVIASHLPGPAEVVTHEKDGLLFPAGDVTAFACAIRRLAHDPSLREKLAKAALESGRRFDEDVVMPQLADALHIPIHPGTNP